tara:strand:- start:3639 stop:3833 length:195 start_codon:yes stop_codon:yes gene_type:complete
MDEQTAKTVYQLTSAKEIFKKKLSKHKKFLDYLIEELTEFNSNVKTNGMFSELIEEIIDFNLEC